MMMGGCWWEEKKTWWRGSFFFLERRYVLGAGLHYQAATGPLTPFFQTRRLRREIQIRIWSIINFSRHCSIS